MHDLECFAALLRRDFTPLLFEQGFIARGGVFRRDKDERVDIISLQGSRRGRRCCVNLGVHYRFLPPAGGARVTETGPTRLRAYDCAFTKRLAEQGEQDCWWEYGTDEPSAAASVTSLVDIFQRRGHQYFAAFEPFPQAFADITPSRLTACDLSTIPGGHSPAHVALTMARLMRYAEQYERCREFAEMGLRSLDGVAGMGTILERELRWLRDPE